MTSGMKPEFQAVILAGGIGNRLQEIAEDFPKAMLPVANSPLLHYQLTLLESIGFTGVIVVTTHKAAKLITNFVLATHPELAVDLHVIEEHMGTADALRTLKGKIVTDFIVVSGDLVTNISLQPLLNMHRANAPALTALFKRSHSASQQQQGEKSEGLSLDYVSIDPISNRLLSLTSSAEINDNLIIHRSILRKYQTMRIETSLLDAHAYVFAPWVMEYLELHPHLESIKYELVPTLAIHQFTAGANDLPEQVLQPGALYKILDYPTPPEPYSCYACVVEDGYLIRVNTIPLFVEANLSARDHLQFVAPSVTLGQKAHVSADCIVGEDVKVGERTSVKRCVVGSHCTIGVGVKLTNSVIMDHVTIEDDCQITNSIVCANSRVQTKASLKNCQVTHAFSVPPQTKASGVVLKFQSGAIDLDNPDATEFEYS
eukprot:c17584_g1_i1.p1 GENE.c17584_g1_i1~~c17584_g1_i1.p1  ORF type:complete len:430 (-),score=102.04 c17584_g1_i1:893-2182(-)